jgi:hypothetical protein
MLKVKNKLMRVRQHGNNYVSILLASRNNGE